MAVKKLSCLDGTEIFELKVKYATSLVLWLQMMIKMLHYLRIYFLDESDQIGSRMAITDNLRPEILLDLQQSLHVHNIYGRELKSAYEYVHEHQLKDFNISIVEKARPLGEHATTCKEIAMLMPNEPYSYRDIILFSKSNQLKRICELYPAYDPLQYPLLFSTENDGWSLHLKATKKVSQLQFYR